MSVVLFGKQRTLKAPVRFEGVGLHSGATVSVTIRPASANSGVVFQRLDLPERPYISAKADNVLDTLLATRIGTTEASVATIEHLMAALFGFGVDNALVQLDSFEIPILDGSAAPFLALLDEVGVVELDAPKKVFVVKKAIEVADPKDSTRFVRVEPSTKPWISYVIDFPMASAIGRQQVSAPLSGLSFCEEFSYARTFCLAEEVAYMKSKGLARGGSLENAIVVSRTDGVLNVAGLRQEQEFVRHKVLDCVGDLALLGMPIVGHVIASKAGHDLHTALAAKLLLEARSSESGALAPTKSRDLSVLKNVLVFPFQLGEVNLSGVAALVRG